MMPWMRRWWPCAAALVALAVVAGVAAGARAGGDVPAGAREAGDAAPSGGAGGSGPAAPWSPALGPVDGACVGGRPEISGPPGILRALAAQGVVVYCGPRGELVLDFPPAPVQPSGPLVPVQQRLRPIPPDFDGWVMLWVNGWPLRVPARAPDGRWEPDAYVVRSTARTVMPIRFFTEAIGGEVAWDPDGQAVTLRYGGREVRLAIGRHEAYVDGRAVWIDQPPFLWLDRTLLPTRFLMEAFGAQVEWDPANAAVRIHLPGALCLSDRYCGEPVETAAEAVAAGLGGARAAGGGR